MTEPDLEFDCEPPAETVAERATEESGGPPFVCSYCARPFARSEWLVLHRGLDHDADITDAEREAFVEAYEGEEEGLRLFRLKALIVLLFVYFGFVMAYSVFA